MNANISDKVNTFANSCEIQAAVDRLASSIEKDYEGKNPLLVGVLKGGFVFLADLSRKLRGAIEIDFIGLSSYGKNTVSSGKINLYCEPRTKVTGRDVILVEDIVDTGCSTAFALSYLQSQGVKSLKLCALLDKPSRREIEIKIDYTGFKVPDYFLVGYGMDYNERFRNLSDIIILGEG